MSTHACRYTSVRRRGGLEQLGAELAEREAEGALWEKQRQALHEMKQEADDANTALRADVADVGAQLEESRGETRTMLGHVTDLGIHICGGTRLDVCVGTHVYMHTGMRIEV